LFTTKENAFKAYQFIKSFYMFNVNPPSFASLSKLAMPVLLVIATTLSSFSLIQVEAVSTATFNNTATDLYATICIDGVEVTNGIPVDPGMNFNYTLNPGTSTVRIVDTDVFFNIWNAGDYCASGNTNDYPIVGEYQINVADNQSYTFNITGGGNFNSLAYFTVDMFTFGNVSSMGNSGIVSSVDALCIDGTLTYDNNDFFALQPGTYTVQPASFLGVIGFSDPCSSENHWPQISVTVLADEATLTDFDVYPYANLEFIPGIDLMQVGVSSFITESDLDMPSSYFIYDSNNYPTTFVVPVLNGVTGLPPSGIYVSVNDVFGNNVYTDNCSFDTGALYCNMPTNLVNTPYTVFLDSADFSNPSDQQILDVLATIVNNENSSATANDASHSSNPAPTGGLIRTGGSDN
jgi:hypothetical protein